jgi:hypothetical protein
MYIENGKSFINDLHVHTLQDGVNVFINQIFYVGNESSVSNNYPVGSNIFEEGNDGLTVTGGLLASKANQTDIYTKSEIDSSLASKANQTDVYTKSEIDSSLASKADIFNKIIETPDSVVIDSTLQIQNNNIEFLRPTDEGKAASIDYQWEGLILKEERGGDITSIQLGSEDITMKTNETERLLIKRDGNIEMKSNLYLGESDGSSATLYMSGGASGDADFNYSVIETRQFGTTDNSELLLFKGNDATPSSNIDRIRLRSSEINIDTFSENSTSRTDQNTIAKFDANGLRMYRNDMDIVNFQVSTNQYDNDRIRVYRYANGGGIGNNYFYYNKDHNFGKGSDRRSKKNIEDLEEEDIEFLMKIRPRRYSLIGNVDEGGCCQYGMVAQEVADVCSTMHQQKIVNHYDEYIADSNTEKTLGLSYESFIPLLIKTVQVQDTKIKTLEAEIEAIKAQLA